MDVHSASQRSVYTPERRAACQRCVLVCMLVHFFQRFTLPMFLSHVCALPSPDCAKYIFICASTFHQALCAMPGESYLKAVCYKQLPAKLISTPQASCPDPRYTTHSFHNIAEASLTTSNSPPQPRGEILRPGERYITRAHTDNNNTQEQRCNIRITIN